jgi:hypothetical protein
MAALRMQANLLLMRVSVHTEPFIVDDGFNVVGKTFYVQWLPVVIEVL